MKLNRLLGITFILLAGCGQGTDNLSLIPINGTVTYQGKPIQDGEIRLVPSEGTEAPARTRKIKDGAYRFSDRSAVAPGVYRVEIKAYRSPEGDKTNETGLVEAGHRKQFLPSQFNTKSEIDNIIVNPDDSEVSQNYDLK